ncbi:hypothetical protein NDU88_001066 [Pleurodeles waltl]|uniref:Uncharacterized protein n=1 Tax=Pleurodeles waltl TaxID=8319 RepID=A0AAV7MLM1_PLEWA|nr:hypothetical protein NDU88_001066 [Pleurodeles waltl]
MGSLPPVPASSSGVPCWAHLVGHPVVLWRLHQNGVREAPSQCREEVQERRATLTSAAACTRPSPRPQVHAAVSVPPGVPLATSGYVLPATGREVYCKAPPLASARPHRLLQPCSFPVTTLQSLLSGGQKGMSPASGR